MVRGSILRNVDGYLLTGCLHKKVIFKVGPFPSAKTEDRHDYLKTT